MHYLMSDTAIVWRKEFISCNILIDGKLLKNLQESLVRQQTIQK